MGLIYVPGQGFDQDDDTTQQVSPELLHDLVAKTVERNRQVPRTDPRQQKLDMLIAEHFYAGEVKFAALLLMVQASACAGVLTEVLEDVMSVMAILQPMIRENQQCRVCGCTNAVGCPNGCDWIELDLCSNCVGEPRLIAAR